jgi:outer membrane protein OmpA-like peptidoglycan-associated protein
MKTLVIIFIIFINGILQADEIKKYNTNNFYYFNLKEILEKESDQETSKCIFSKDELKKNIAIVGNACSFKKEVSRNIKKFTDKLVESSNDYRVIIIDVPIKKDKEYEHIPVLMIDFKKDLFFDFNSSELKNQGYIIIMNFIHDVVLPLSVYNIITVIGHTDNVGTEKANFLLSKKRSDIAISAIQKQIKDSGSSPDSFTIESVGAGEMQQVEYFAQETKSQENRRIDILLSTSSNAMYNARRYIQCISKKDIDPTDCFNKYLSPQKASQF